MANKIQPQPKINVDNNITTKYPMPTADRSGEPEQFVATTGVETRGNGAATKGRKAHGPLG